MARTATDRDALQDIRDKKSTARERRAQLRRKRDEAVARFRDNPSQHNADEVQRLKADLEAVDGDLETLSEQENDLLRGLGDAGGLDAFGEPSHLKFRPGEFNEAQDAVGSIQEFARSNATNRYGRRLLGSYTIAATLAMTGGAIRAMEGGSFHTRPLGATGTVKTTDQMETGIDRIIPSLQAPLTLLDVIPTGPMEAGIVPYARELPVSGAPAPTLPGQVKPGLDIEYIDDSATAETIAGWTRVYKQQIRDVPGLDLRLRTIIPQKVREALEAQVLNGTGISPQIGPGLLVDTAIPSLTFSSTPYLMDLVLAAVIDLLNVGISPVVTVLNPTDYGTMVGSKNTQNEYVGGGPFVAGGLQTTLWGTLPVASPAVPTGVALVGDTRQGSRLWVREAVQLFVSDSDSDDFTRNKLTFLGEGAWAFTNEVPQAWRKVDLSAT